MSEETSISVGPMHIEKSPLGVMPRWRHNELRCIELLQAMLRYIEVGKAIPVEWLDEVTELVCVNPAKKEQNDEHRQSEASHPGPDRRVP